ncbi:ATP-binding protein [Dyella sp. C11]|uniref:ATP-binding protein n=1 Tax=Dyella sp. C11 TaxID=2126991 RepID=UPI000D6546DF|nr:ATP-binding protein [Dyella sp. C11]
MSAASTGLFTRLVWLLIGTACLVLLIAMFALRVTGSGVASDYTARVLTMQVTAADTLLEEGRGDAALTALGIEHRAAPPASREPSMPLLRHVRDQLRTRLPDRNVQISGWRQPMLWLIAREPGQGWIGIPFEEWRAPLVRSTLLTVLLSTLVVLLLAASYARSLTQPLKRLADAAPSVVGGTPPPDLPHGAAGELVELNAALGMAAADVRRNARERDVMLAAISHDLRTPLARLRLGLELSSASIEPSLREGLVSDIEAIDALSAQFIAYVRDGSEESTSPVDLAALLRELATLNDVDANTWQVDVPEHVRILGKPMALRRAIDNLMRNAMRHGAAPYGASLVVAGNEARCVITDHGTGVPEHLLNRLGEPFLRGNEARSDAVGNGLGLASTRRIAAQHGGRLLLRNLPAGGFEAMLVLPLRSDDARSPPR